MTSTGWLPGHWWRVVDADGQVWSETSVEVEARKALETCPGGGVLQRLWAQYESEWRTA